MFNKLNNRNIAHMNDLSYSETLKMKTIYCDQKIKHLQFSIDEIYEDLKPIVNWLFNAQKNEGKKSFEIDYEVKAECEQGYREALIAIERLENLKNAWIMQKRKYLLANNKENKKLWKKY